jgi:DNA-binding beta-propeller fold protein YncE
MSGCHSSIRAFAAASALFTTSVSAQQVFFGDTDLVEIREQLMMSEDGDMPFVSADFPAGALVGLMGEPAGISALPLDPATLLSTGSDPEGDQPVSVKYLPDGSEVLIAHAASNTIVRFDASTLAFIGAVNLTHQPIDMDIAPDGSVAVCANLADDTATIVDLSTMTELVIVPVGDGPGRVHVSGDSAYAVVGNAFDSTLSVVSLATNTVERTIATPGFVTSLSFSPETGAFQVQFNEHPFIDNTTVLFPGYFDATIELIDVTTGTSTSIASAANPRGIGISADNSTAAVVHPFSNRTLTVIDVATKSVANTITSPDDMWGPISLNSDGTLAAVAIQNATKFANLTTGSFGSSLNTASVNQMHTTSDGLYAVAVGFRGSLLSFASQTLVKDLNNQVSCTLGGVSPTASQVAMCSTTFGEDLVVMSTNGAAGTLEFFGPSGPPPEGDKCRTSAVSADGSIAIGVNNFSDTATLFDSSGNVTGYAPTGMRPAEVAITPDGTTAVVANLDSFFVTVIDTAAATSTEIPIGRRASQVEISPDGGYAYVCVVADGDGVYRINLNTLAVDGPKILTGNMSSVGYTFSQTSDMKLSPDGKTLIVCGSFTDEISFIDAENWAFMFDFATPDFPTRATFSDDSKSLYVACKNTDQIVTFDEFAPGVWVAGATINVGDQPFDMVLSDDQTVLYVSNWGDLNVGVVDLVGGTQTTTIPTAERITGMTLSSNGLSLYAASGSSTTTVGAGVFETTNSGQVEHIDLVTNAVVQSDDIGFVPAMLSSSDDRAVISMPSPPADGLIVTGEEGDDCLADVNGDGSVTPTDFTAWINAFNNNLPECDQNGDGSCTPTDFTAWIANFNAGC